MAGLFVNRPAWHADALCKEYPGLSWFPERGTSAKAIRDICRRCAVRTECAEAGKEEPYGWWGGQSERMRPHMRN